MAFAQVLCPVFGVPEAHRRRSRGRQVQSVGRKQRVWKERIGLGFDTYTVRLSRLLIRAECDY
jgi:hypothetical protein